MRALLLSLLLPSLALGATLEGSTDSLEVVTTGATVSLDYHCAWSNVTATAAEAAMPTMAGTCAREPSVRPRATVRMAPTSGNSGTRTSSVEEGMSCMGCGAGPVVGRPQEGVA